MVWRKRNMGVLPLARVGMEILDWKRRGSNFWPQIDIQRCTVHQRRNLEAKAPARMREELAKTTGA